MDITSKFPAEIVDMIFHQLDGNDLKRAMLVSSKWNEHIIASTRCMNKLMLVIEGLNTLQGDFKHLLESKWKCPHIAIHDGDFIGELIYEIVEEKHLMSHLKTVHVFNAKFETTLDFFNFVKVFESTVEQLLLSGVALNETDDLSPNLKFPKLRKLSIKFCEQNTLLDTFLQSTSLEVLNLGKSKVKATKPAELVEMLTRCKSLKKLSLNGETFSSIFSSDISSVEFKLTDFLISNLGTRADISETSGNLKIFLQSQSQTIKKLYLGNFFGSEILRFVFEMKSLKELKMDHLPFLNWESQNLISSTTIEIFDIMTTDIRNKERMKILLRSVPNVKRLRLRSIDPEILAFIQENSSEARRIQVLCRQHKLRAEKTRLGLVRTNEN